MRSPKVLSILLALLALLAASPAAAQAPETFNFPQNHDTVFGDNLFLGNFNWYAQGQGVKGRRTAANFDRLDAFGFNLLLGPSCIFAGTNMTLDVYVNDRFLGNFPLPGQILCNSVPLPIQGSFDLSSDPLPGMGTGKDFEIRFQLSGSAAPPCCGLFVFYAIDINNSTIAMAGHLNGGDGGGGGDDGGGGGGGGGGTTDHTEVLNRIGQAETNLAGAISSDGTTTRSAVQQVRDALGMVEGNVNASIAGAVLKVNAETALGIDKLATQLGVSTQDLSFAIKGNNDAIGKVQKSIEEKLMPEILKGQDLTQITTAKVEEVGKSFLDKTLGTALSSGIRLVSLYAGGGIFDVAGFVDKTIQSVISGNLRPDRIVKKAVAEFNRGLKKLKGIFKLSASTLSTSDASRIEALQEIPGGDPDSSLGADTEENSVFGAYVWFERAYQTLVKGSTNGSNTK